MRWRKALKAILSHSHVFVALDMIQLNLITCSWYWYNLRYISCPSQLQNLYFLFHDWTLKTLFLISKWKDKLSSLYFVLFIDIRHTLFWKDVSFDNLHVFGVKGLDVCEIVSLISKCNQFYLCNYWAMFENTISYFSILTQS